MGGQLAERLAERGAPVQPLRGGLEPVAYGARCHPGQFGHGLRRRQAGVQTHHDQLDGVRHRCVDRLLRRTSFVVPAECQHPDDARAPDDRQAGPENDRRRRHAEDQNGDHTAPIGAPALTIVGPRQLPIARQRSADPGSSTSAGDED